MRAVSACFGGEYPEQPFGLETKESSYREDEENYTEEEIMQAKEAFIASLAIKEGMNKRAKAREERRRLREQQQQGSDSE